MMNKHYVINQITQRHNDLMASFLIRIVVFLCLVTGTSGAAIAASTPFTVDNIVTSADGKSATDARQKAQQDAELRAFYTLMKRITPAYLHDNLDAVAFTPADVSALVQGMDISDERVTSRYYQATYSVTFSQPLVQRFMRDKDIPYQDGSSKPLLILPVLYEKHRAILWDEDNSWLSAWNKQVTEPGFLRIIVPESDSAANIRIEDVLASDEALSEIPEIRGLMQRYQADSVILTEASYTYNEDRKNYFLQVFLTDSSTKRRLTFHSKQGQEIADFLLATTESIKEQIEATWRAKTFMSARNEKELRIVHPITSMQRWRDTVDTLRSLPQLDEVAIYQLTSREVWLDVSFKAPYEDVISALKSKGLNIEYFDDSAPVLTEYVPSLKETQIPVYDERTGDEIPQEEYYGY